MEFIILLILICFFRKVPPQSLIIIDRNSHYLKTKRNGFYFLWPMDKVTTTVSKNPLSRTLTDYYETDDGKVISATVTCRYKADDLDRVQQALADVRRSSAYFAIGNYTFAQIVRLNSHEFADKVRDNLRDEFASLGISLLGSHVSIVPTVTYGLPCFKPHVSNNCGLGSASTPHAHTRSEAIQSKDIYRNGPIISK